MPPYRLADCIQWGNAVSIRSLFGRIGYIHTSVSITTCLARPSVAQTPMINEKALLDSSAISIGLRFPYRYLKILGKIDGVEEELKSRSVNDKATLANPVLFWCHYDIAFAFKGKGYNVIEFFTVVSPGPSASTNLDDFLYSSTDSPKHFSNVVGKC